MPTATSSLSTSGRGAVELIKGLRLFDATTLVMGSMIGSGVFIVAADMARQLQSPSLFLLAWVISGIMTVIAAISYGELAAMMPRAGGQYVYLREAFGPLSGFLYGWTLFLVIQTGTIAAVAVAFGKFLGVFFPWISAHHLFVNLGTYNLFGHSTAITASSQQLTAILALLVLAAINIFGLRTGALVQNVFTVLKVGALLGMFAIGLWWSLSHPLPAGSATQLDHAGDGRGFLPSLTLIAVALVGPLFSSDAWNNVTFTGAEVVNPKRNLPLALFAGTSVVCAMYFFCNWIYLRILPFFGNPAGLDPLARGVQFATEDRVATAAMQVIFGPAGSGIMAAAIVVSTFGCMNGMTLAGARVYYAMARDGLFFGSVAKVHPRYHTPLTSLIVQAVWASLLTLTGTYNELLDYVIFAAILFYLMTVVGLFRLRYTMPAAPRPYRAWGYPVLPALYVLFALFVEWALIIHKPLRSVAGLCIVALGVPVFYWWQRTSRAGPETVQRGKNG
jgi:APA family basic amino acid/polyamine antiporter